MSGTGGDIVIGTGFDPRCAGCNYFVQGRCVLDDCLLPAFEAGAGVVLSSGTAPVVIKNCSKHGGVK